MLILNGTWVRIFLLIALITFISTMGSKALYNRGSQVEKYIIGNAGEYLSDTTSADEIIAALYSVISGPAGEKRNWDRFRSLFFPGARMIATGKRPDGQAVIRVMDPEEYIKTSGAYIEKNGFFEKEINRKTESFGTVTHCFSTYETRSKAEDEKPSQRGINSIQLFNDGKRWWIMTVYWFPEGKDNAIPDEYLKQ